ncbi:MAG TPA: alpha-amylase family glycosyl hydrolase, partial [Chitinophagaceae bacterium]
IGAAIDLYEGSLPDYGWPNWVLGNHDQPRITSRIGQMQARVAALLLLTLRGTPTIYYGEEIGMTDVPIPFDEVQDPQGLNMPDKNLSRDPARTPMQWDNSANAGFTTGKPWLRIDKSYRRVNVEVQKEDSHSTLSFYRKLIAFRQNEPSLKTGRYIPVHADPQFISYIRCAEGQPRYLVVLNVSHRPCYYTPKHPEINGQVVIGTVPELEGRRVSGEIYLSGDEGIIIKLDN